VSTQFADRGEVVGSTAATGEFWLVLSKPEPPARRTAAHQNSPFGEVSTTG